MRCLNVFIELNGTPVPVGSIKGNDSSDASFSYSPDYLNMPGARPISISLPLRSDPFGPELTRSYFEGLLPEGFLKMTVARNMRIEENDYLTILAGLGRECLGAVMILEEGSPVPSPSYERLTIEDIRNLAREGAARSVQLVTQAHLSLAGASGKAGLYYDEDNMQWYVPLGTAPSTHIVKQSHIRLDDIVTNEQLSLLTGQKLGLNVPESHIINTGDAGEGQVLFAAKRYDRVIGENSRVINGLKAPLRLHQEDFAQALGIPSAGKYESDGESHMKDMFALLRRYSSDPIGDQLRLWDIIIFDWLIGNTDSHIKNLSLLYGKGLSGIRLAPAYDILSTAIYSSSTREMAFAIGGERSLDRITRQHFTRAARDCGLGERMALKRFDDMAAGFEKALSLTAEELRGRGFERALKLKERILAIR